MIGSTFPLSAKDDGRYKDSPLKSWFDGLKSQKGLCCSFADGKTVTDADWETRDNHYIVKLDDGNWYDVPPEALITVPNKFGQAVVWPYTDSDNKVQIRCFLPGAGT
jgi:hypothetical protein